MTYEEDYIDEIKRLERVVADRDEELKDSDHDINYYADIIFKMTKLLENYEYIDDDIKEFLEDYQFVLHNIERNRP
jgi:hypothetical protein